jgi:hypothetical protein
MSDTELLIKEIETLPVDYAARVLDFIKSLKETTRTVPPGLPPEEALRVSAKRSAARRGNPASENIFDFASIFDREDVAIIERIIGERHDPFTGPDLVVP